MESLFLTRQENLVLQLVCNQKSNLEISRMLFISPYTVTQHKQNIKRKIGCKTSLGFLVYALKKGVVLLEDIGS
ncbi:MAG: helix-turn-helix transcriptional regulator [Bacteroidota bacterium]